MKMIILKILFVALILAGIVAMELMLDKNKATKIAFLGDSITEFGWLQESGYVRKVSQGLNSAGIHFELIPAGIAGNTTYDMLQRLDKDVLDKKPDIVFLMGGINDIWHYSADTKIFSNNVKNIIDRINEHGAKPIIISLTLITEDISAPENKKIDEFNKFLKEYTSKNGILYIDVNTAFKNELKKYNNMSGVLTIDGVHLNDKGNQILADTILTEFLKTYKP